MKRIFYSVLILAIFGFGTDGVLIPTAFAAVTVTAATSGTNISADKAANATSPQFTTLGNIVITEGAKDDFAVSANNTLILTAPSGWQFNAGAGTVSFASSNNITSASISVAASTIAVTLSVDKTNKFDTLTISGIQVRATDGGSLPSSGNILRTSANPGTQTIAGITNGTTNFGSLSQVAGAVSASQSTVSASPTGVSTDGGAQTTITVTAKDQFGNSLSGKSVTLSSTGTGNTLTQPSGTTNASGQTTGTLSSTKAEAKTISATISGTSVTQTASTTFNAGALDYITVTPSGSQSVVGGVTIAFSAQGYDVNNNSVSGLTFTWAVVAGTGSGTVSSGGMLTGGRAGTLTVTATSGAKTGTSGTVTVTNVAPTVNNQSVSTNEDAGLSINLSGTDANGDTITYSIVSNPSHGSLSGLNSATGAVTYNPSSNYNGSDSFTFKTNDGTADSNTGTISITVNPVNDAPVLNSIGNKSVNENQLLSFTISATDPENDSLTYSASNLPSGATFDANIRTFSWTPSYSQSGSYSNVHFQVTDGSLTASEDIAITVNNVNQAPILNTIGNKSADENQNLNFVISGSDADNDTLTYSASNLPSGATFDDSTRIFDWTPGFSQSGNYSVTFRISDGLLEDTEVVPIDVGNVNRTPILDDIGNKNVAEGHALSFTISGSDPDNDPLTYSASNLPTGASFDTSNRTFSWTPSYDQAGTYNNVHFEVTDGSLTDFENITITVSNTNRAPVLSSIGNKTIDENQNLKFTLSANDPDANVLIYSADNLPIGASLDFNAGSFYWTPNYSQAGTYTPTFRVCDNDPSSLCAQETITITVNNVNRAPVLNFIGNKTADENSDLQFIISGSDLDGDLLTYSASNSSSGATFDPNTRTFSWTPSYSQSGIYNLINFQATDGTSTVSEDITITVNNVNRSPILNAIRDKSIDENTLLSFAISGSDPDSDTLTYSASNLPSGATFDASTKTFSWKPSFNQNGNYPAIYFQVTDGSLTASEDIAINVKDVSQDSGGVAGGGGGGSLASYNYGPSPIAPTLVSSAPAVSNAENIPAAVTPTTIQQELNKPVSLNAANQNPGAGNKALLASVSQVVTPSQGQNTAKVANSAAPQGNTSLLANVTAFINTHNIFSAAKSLAKNIYQAFDYLKNFFARFFFAR